MAGGVVVIGGGQAGAEAALALRQAGYTENISVFGDEAAIPYSRPPLSKDFLTGSLPAERLLLRSQQAFEKAGISLKLGVRVAAVDVAQKRLVLGSGESHAYDFCIFATGSEPRRLSLPGGDLDNVLTFRSRDDAERFRTFLKPGASIAILGAGYLGLELAASARKLGADVVVLEAADRILARSTSALTADALAARHRTEGVDIRLGCQLVAITSDNERLKIHLAGNDALTADVLVVSIGATPTVALAQDAGIACDGGILADADCRTSAPDVFAIGDCAAWNRGDGRGTVRLESVQMASQGARVVAAAITGGARPAPKLPYFWSHQFDLNLQIAGYLPPGTQTEDFLVACDGAAFAVTRHVDGELVAVEAVNMPSKFVEAQRQIGNPVRSGAEVKQYA